MAKGVTKAPKRLAFLDSLRFFGAVIVVAIHLFETRVSSEAARVFLNSGWGVGAVVMFFVISGYVTPLAVRHGLVLSEFVIRRLFRLLPLYAFALLIITFGGLTGLIGHWSYMLMASPWTWIANAGLFWEFAGVRPFLGVSWTLAIEFIWYGFFALGFYLFGDRLGRVLDIFMPTFMLALAAISLLLDMRIPLGRPGMIYVCVFGFQVYRYLNGKMSGRALAINVAVFFVVTMFTNTVAFGVFPHQNMRLAPVLLSWTVSPLLFLLCALIRPVRDSAILNRGVFPWFGNISYSIYLLHPIAIAVSLQYLSGGWDRPFAVGFTILLAMVGYYLVELPMIAVGRRLTERKTQSGSGQPRTA